MKLVSFSLSDGKVRPGALIEDGSLVVDLGAAGYADALAVIAAGITAPEPGHTFPSYPIADLRLHAPLANPPRVFAIGLNYRDHAIESGMAIPTTPVIFFKVATAIVGPGDAIVLPVNSTQPDYEAEFAFVIGHGGFRISADEAMKHVYGYTIVNDVSARGDAGVLDAVVHVEVLSDVFAPWAPAIVTADERLPIRTR